MSDYNQLFSSLAKAGGAIGKGLIAGFAGTVAITVSQMIEMQITKRSMSNAPVKVGGKTLGVEPKGEAELEKEKAASENDEASEAAQKKVESNQQKFTQIMHFSYGTGWGVLRGVLDLAEVRGLPASLVHFGGIWGAAQVMLPAAGASEPITKWPAEQIIIDVMHHAVYALAAGAVYDAMATAESREKQPGKNKQWRFF